LSVALTEGTLSRLCPSGYGGQASFSLLCPTKL